MATRKRDRLFINKSDRKDYEMLLKSKESPFLGQRNRVPFMMAVLLGVREGTRTKLRKGKTEWIFIDYLTDRDETIIKAIAVSEIGDLNALLDNDEVYTIAEEYATTGIKLLKERVFSGGYGTFAKKFESSLVTLFENIVKPSIGKAKGTEVKKKTLQIVE